MDAIEFSDFSGGMDRRKGRTGRYDESLWLLQNCYIDRGGVVRKRPGLKRVKTLANDAFGLYSAFGKLHTFQNSGYYSEPEDSLIKHHTLAIPSFYTGNPHNEYWYQTEVITIKNIYSDNNSIYVDCSFFDVNNVFVDAVKSIRSVTLKLDDKLPLLNGAYAMTNPISYFEPKDSGINEMTGLIYHVPEFYDGTLDSGDDSLFNSITLLDDRVTEGQVFIPATGTAGFQVVSREVTGLDNDGGRIVTLFQRAFRVDGGSVSYSEISLQDQVDGWIDTDSNFQGDTTQTIARIGKDTLVVFGQSSVQLWKVDSDPSNFRLAGVIQGGGCYKSASIKESDNGITYLSNGTLMSLSLSEELEDQFQMEEVSYKADDIVKNFDTSIYGASHVITDAELIGFGGTVTANNYTRTLISGTAGTKAKLTPLLDTNVPTAVFGYNFVMPNRINAKIGMSENLTDFTLFNGLYFDFKTDGTINTPLGDTGTTLYNPSDTITIVIAAFSGLNIIVLVSINSTPVLNSLGNAISSSYGFATLTPIYPTMELLAANDTILNVTYDSDNWGGDINFTYNLKSRFNSIYLSDKNQYWCVDKTQAIVFFKSEVGKSEGIALYTFPFEIDYIATLNNEIYIMAGSNLYQLDDQQYTDDGEIFEVRVESHFLDFDSGMDSKHILGADVLISGNATLEVMTDYNSDMVDFSFPIEGHSATYGTLPVEAVTPSIAVNIVNNDNQAFTFHGFNFYFEIMGMV